MQKNTLSLSDESDTLELPVLLRQNELPLDTMANQLLSIARILTSYTQTTPLALFEREHLLEQLGTYAHIPDVMRSLYHILQERDLRHGDDGLEWYLAQHAPGITTRDYHSLVSEATTFVTRQHKAGIHHHTIEIQVRAACRQSVIHYLQLPLHTALDLNYLKLIQAVTDQALASLQ